MQYVFRNDTLVSTTTLPSDGLNKTSKCKAKYVCTYNFSATPFLSTFKLKRKGVGGRRIHVCGLHYHLCSPVFNCKYQWCKCACI